MDSRIDDHFRQHRAEHLADLEAFVRIPSVSADPERRTDVRRTADWLAAKLGEAGIQNARLAETAGNPVVTGEWLAAPGKPTILIYGHYDVQPADPLESWESPPFEPTHRDGRIYARGISDDKGPLWQAVKAVEAILTLDVKLPVNLKFCFEGEEEIGSPNLRSFLEANAQQLACDLVISTDGAMWRASEPSLTIAGKGMCGLEVHVKTARSDVHSGRHGGAVPNALHALAQIVAGLHDEAGGIAVDGFYDRVIPLTLEDRAVIAAFDFDEMAYMRELGMTALVGEAGYTTLERNWARPTLDLNGMWGGFTGPGAKTVIACEAHAKLSCRLVPGQVPDEVLTLIEAHIQKHAPKGATVSFTRKPGKALPYAMPADLPALRAAAEVLEEVLGKKALYVRMGATLPSAEMFQVLLGAYTLFFSFSTADEQYHAPNEFFRMDRFDAGLRAWALLLNRLGTSN
jgi:acetylornithine deacetylase/succinyl-diaminopimelate desuccinylase-like protein